MSGEAYVRGSRVGRVGEGRVLPQGVVARPQEEERGTCLLVADGVLILRLLIIAKRPRGLRVGHASYAKN